MNELNELALRSVDAGGEFSQIFIADTGASGHMSGSTEGMRNLRKCEDSVIVVNGRRLRQRWLVINMGSSLIEMVTSGRWCSRGPSMFQS